MSRITNKYLKYLVAFSQISAIGPIRWQQLMNYFPEAETAWRSPYSDFIRAGIHPRIAEKIVSRRIQIDPDNEMAKVEKSGAKIIIVKDKNYPDLLAEIYAPPLLLYCLGEFNLNNDFCLAVVGSRKMTGYGQQVAEQITGKLAQVGLTIISGLALGIDAVVANSAVKNGGKTIAVLGSGIDKIYPTANRLLAKEIIASDGAIISEFPLGTPPLKFNFPRRNRLISGLSLGTLVIEASKKSGALITARYALEQNREVFAVPGNIYSELSSGTNELIRQGAHPVSDAEEILEILELKNINIFKKAKENLPTTETEKKLLGLLTCPIHVDKIVQSSRLDISLINSTLSIMEMKGMIKNLGNQIYVKAR